MHSGVTPSTKSTVPVGVTPVPVTVVVRVTDWPDTEEAWFEAHDDGRRVERERRFGGARELGEHPAEQCGHTDEWQ